MDHTICPGSKLLRQPEPEEFTCHRCGTEVEIWTDEVRGTCPSCRATVQRDSTMSCLDWCKQGKECVGDAAYANYMANKSMVIKRQLLDAIAVYFEGDENRIDHAKRVLRYAEELLIEEDADWHIVIPASILHDVGIKVAEEKYGSSAGSLQEKEGPAIARKMVLSLGFKLDDVDEICEIIGHHHTPGVIDTTNFKVLFDADTLVNAFDHLSDTPPEKIAHFIDEQFLTDSGIAMAKRELIVSVSA